MVLGVGCDLTDVERIKKALQQKGFKERVFTAEEIAYCTGAHGDKNESYAARFAAKEAFLKALGTGLRGGRLTEITVTNDALGKPQIKLTGYFAELAAEKGVTAIQVSLSHIKTTAMAVVLLETQ